MWGKIATFGTIAQIRLNPRKGGVEAKHSQLSRLEMILQVKMILQGAAAIALHHALHDHHTNGIWQKVNHMTHLLVMMIAMVRESPP
jgi:ribulose bisphosphate carboxylase small subunit